MVSALLITADMVSEPFNIPSPEKESGVMFNMPMIRVLDDNFKASLVIFLSPQDQVSEYRFDPLFVEKQQPFYLYLE